jgi:phospholipid/cholesterol/gamma-HCH transport system permease protein
MNRQDVQIEVRADEARVSPRGRLDVHGAGALYAALDSLARRAELRRVVVDLSLVEVLDGAGIATLSIMAERLHETGRALTVEGVSEAQRAALSMMPARARARPAAEEVDGFFARVGDAGYRWRDEARALWEMLAELLSAALAVLRRPRTMPWEALIEQSVEIGVRALGILALLAYLLGMILAFQASYQLQQFGATNFVANLVGISMAREFGPIITGVILAGRTGSAIAAELGTMTVQEEIDALRTMGIDPARYLLLPRLCALLLVQPALTLMADLVGMAGGMFIAAIYLDVVPAAYIQQSLSVIRLGDFMQGLIKAVLFAGVIGLVGSLSGLRIEGGASGVGRATTQAVVRSIFLIIVVDSVVTTIATLMK